MGKTSNFMSAQIPFIMAMSVGGCALAARYNCFRTRKSLLSELLRAESRKELLSEATFGERMDLQVWCPVILRW